MCPAGGDGISEFYALARIGENTGGTPKVCAENGKIPVVRRMPFAHKTIAAGGGSIREIGRNGRTDRKEERLRR
ncbi:MAG TPA: hypothetical protein DCZ61_09170 [Lachnospiraceae bacterium]|nr:hypothetical protein [Lachnospiraceae bacterium]